MLHENSYPSTCTRTHRISGLDSADRGLLCGRIMRLSPRSLVLSDESGSAVLEVACSVENVAAGDLAEAATKLFAMLRALDERFDRIAVAPVPQEGLGEAINDRLARAAWRESK